MQKDQVFHIGNGRKYNIVTRPSSLVCQGDTSTQQTRTRRRAELVSDGKAGWLVCMV